MNKSQVLSDITVKVAELNEQVAKAKADEKSCGRIKRQARALNVVAELIELYAPDEFKLTLEKELQAMIKPTKGHTDIEVNEGDNFIQLAMVKYRDLHNIVERLTKQADKKGLILNGNGVYVKK